MTSIAFPKIMWWISSVFLKFSRVRNENVLFVTIKILYRLLNEFYWLKKVTFRIYFLVKNFQLRIYHKRRLPLKILTKYFLWNHFLPLYKKAYPLLFFLITNHFVVLLVNFTTCHRHYNEVFFRFANLSVAARRQFLGSPLFLCCIVFIYISFFYLQKTTVPKISK